MKVKKTIPIAIGAIVILGIILSVYTSGILTTQPPTKITNNLGGTSNNLDDNLTGSELTSTNIGVYIDAAATINCTNISWGSPNPGDSINQTVYIKNTGNSTEQLSLTATNWNPTIANSFLTLTWDKEGYSLLPGTVVPATLTLTVASETGSLTTFSFDINISGTS